MSSGTGWGGGGGGGGGGDPGFQIQPVSTLLYLAQKRAMRIYNNVDNTNLIVSPNSRFNKILTCFFKISRDQSYMLLILPTA